MTEDIKYIKYEYRFDYSNRTIEYIGYVSHEEQLLYDIYDFSMDTYYVKNKVNAFPLQAITQQSKLKVLEKLTEEEFKKKYPELMI